MQRTRTRTTMPTLGTTLTIWHRYCFGFLRVSGSFSPVWASAATFSITFHEQPLLAVDCKTGLPRRSFVLRPADVCLRNSIYWRWDPVWREGNLTYSIYNDRATCTDRVQSSTVTKCDVHWKIAIAKCSVQQLGIFLSITVKPKVSLWIYLVNCERRLFVCIYFVSSP